MTEIEIERERKREGGGTEKEKRVEELDVSDTFNTFVNENCDLP